jgi:hypothetical protein
MQLLVRALLLALLFLGPCQADVPAGLSCLRFNVNPPSGTGVAVGSLFSVTISFNQPVSIRQAGVWYASTSFPGSKTLLQVLNAVSAVHLIRSDNFQLNPVAAVFLDSNSIQVDFNGADIISSSRYILRLTENFATNDTIRAGMPPNSLNSYYTVGSSPTWPSSPAFDDFCPQIVPYSAPTPTLPSPGSSQILQAQLVTNRTLNVTLELLQGDYTAQFTTVRDSMGNQYELQQAISLRTSLLPPVGEVALLPIASLTPNFELMATQATPATYLWQEMTRAKCQACLDEVAFHGAAMQILTLGQDRPYAPGSDSLDAIELETGFPGSYLSRITFSNGTVVQIGFLQLQPRPQSRWFIIWPNDVGGSSCSAPNARNAWGPDFTSMYHSFGTVTTDPWSHFKWGEATWSHQITASVDDHPAVPIPTDFTDPLDQRWSQLTGSISMHRLVLPDVWVHSYNSSIDTWMLVPEEMFSNGGSTCNKLDLNMYDFVHQAPSICSSSLWSCMGNQLGSFIQNTDYRLSYFLRDDPLLFGYENSTGTDYPRVRIQESDGLFSALFLFNGHVSSAEPTLSLDLQAISNGLRQPALHLPLSWSSQIRNQTSIEFQFQNTNDGDLAANFTAHVNCSHMASSAASTYLLGPGATQIHVLILSLSNMAPNAIVTCESHVYTSQLPLWRTDKSFYPSPVQIQLQPTGCFMNSSSDAFLLQPASAWESSLQNGQNTSAQWLKPGGLLGPNPFSAVPSSGWLFGSQFTASTTVSLSLETVASGDAVVVVEAFCGELQTQPARRTVSIAANVSSYTDVELQMQGDINSYSVNCTLRVTINAGECARQIGKLVEQPFQLTVPAFPCNGVQISEPSLFLPMHEWEEIQSSPNPQPRDLMDTSVFQPWINKPTSVQGWAAFGISMSDVEAETTPFELVYIMIVQIVNAGNGTANFTARASCLGEGVAFSPSLSSYFCTASQDGGSCNLRMTYIANVSSQAFGPASCVVISEALAPPDRSDACWSPFGKLYLQEYTLQRVGEGPTPTASPTKPNRGLFGIGVPGSNALLAVLVILAIGAVGLAIAVAVIVAKKAPEAGYEMAEEPEHSLAPPSVNVNTVHTVGDQKTEVWSDDSKAPHGEGYVL